MKCARLLSIGLVAAAAGGCLHAPVVPPIALIYTDIQAPLDLDQQSTPVASRRGEASTSTILGLVSFGDASVNAAAKAGGLETIENADYSFFNILGIYQKYTTVVYGN